ncbi:helix-turn-helix transcriptional regulator [Lacipirellula sp.]|uniref:helix-turn-helix transcriptional regulator n=1 Tax=Lacipirellula sp. TaxID=2691419 RepID=UPI003D0C2474
MTLTARELKQVLGVKKQTLALWKKNGRLPAPIENSSPQRWDASAIREAILAGSLTKRKAGRKPKPKVVA